jgi:hypothetical protein
MSAGALVIAFGRLLERTAKMPIPTAIVSPEDTAYLAIGKMQFKVGGVFTLAFQEFSKKLDPRHLQFRALRLSVEHLRRAIGQEVDFLIRFERFHNSVMGYWILTLCQKNFTITAKMPVRPTISPAMTCN